MKKLPFALITVFCLICFMPLYADNISITLTDTPILPPTRPGVVGDPYVGFSSYSILVEAAEASADIVEVEVYDNNKTVYYEQVAPCNEKAIKIQLQNCKKGMYTIRIKMRNGTNYIKTVCYQ